jgi:hypothetical protein
MLARLSTGAGLLLVVAAVAAGGESADPSSPGYSTLGGLAAESPLVVEGQVTRVRPGREVADIDPQYPTRFLNTVLSVDEVLKGSPEISEVTVETMELAFSSGPGQPNAEWRTPGARVVAFLSPRGPGGAMFNPTSYTQSLYLVKGARLEPLSAESGELGERIAGMSVPELERAVAGSG